MMKQHSIRTLISIRALIWSGLLLLVADTGFAFLPPANPPLPNLDKRQKQAPQPAVLSADQAAAVAELRAQVPNLRVDFEPVTGSPKRISTVEGFLSGQEGQGKGISTGSLAGFAADDPYRMTKAFLKDHSRLLGFGPEALDQARISREFVTAYNGLRTVVWEQQVDGIAVFEAVLISHTTTKSELVNLCSQFVPNPAAAASKGAPKRAALLAAPGVLARQAVALAAQNVGVELKADGVAAASELAASPEQRQKFTAPGLKGKAETKLTWLPMDRNTLRLCWDVILMSRARGEMFRVLVDAQTGEPLLRHCLTDYISDASYRVFTSDSPSPFSPGSPTPGTTQPPLVPRTLVTLSALDTNASPAGWINDGGNETLGNNVDAHTDWSSDDLPDLPRPQGSPFRVFDFPMDLSTQDPTSYAPAAVVQLFYLNNWMHDKLYELGFTEAAGNFQSDNFARGGLGNDAVQADAQDGATLSTPNCDNANFSTPPDGSAPRMQMYLFCTPSPRRDGDLDADVVLHEYTHGLSNRRVGGGVGISELQSAGMGEGWSDFYALSLLSEAGDDVNGNYAAGGYASYQIGGSSDLQNYYFGIRRYPYTTDMSKNPLTFKDIDPLQADYCSSGAPYHTAMFGTCSASDADEVHNQGELWCVTLWEARANLINRYGWAVGNQLILQLVTDGMNLSPANPTFLQARDAILQADLVDTGGANQSQLWAAFAKRGMGFSATSPASSTTAGVQEAFDLPDDLRIAPNTVFTGKGPVGGPFSPDSISFTLTNAGSNSFSWTAVNTATWLDVLPTGGTLTPGGAAATVTSSVNGLAASLPMGIYSTTVWFTNLSSHVAQSRRFMLRVGQPDYFTELFDSTTNDLAFQTFTFTPDGSTSFYSVCRNVATSFPTDPAGGTTVSLHDDSYASVTLTGADTVAIYNTRVNVFFIGSNGYVTMNSGDSNMVESFANHFDQPRISALFHDLNPEVGGTVSWKQLADQVAVTFQGVCEYGTTLPNSFQIEMYFDGRIQLTYLTINCLYNLVGLSAGQGVPAGFAQSDFGAYSICPPPDVLGVTPFAGFISVGRLGGPFMPSSTAYTLTNVDTNPLNWSAAANQRWVTVDPSSGTLAPGDATAVTVLINTNAQTLAVGAYSASVKFTNLTTTVAQQRGVTLNVQAPVVTITNAGAALLAENCGSGNGAIDPAETVTVNLGLANVGNLNAPDVVATLLATGGVTAPSGPQSYGTLLTGGQAVSNAFTFTATGTCGGPLVATLQLQSGATNLGTVAFSFRLGASSAVFSENFDGVSAPNLPPGWTASLTGAGTRWATTAAQSDTPPNAVFAPDPNSTSENWLTSPSFFLPAGGAQLSFSHAYSTESCCDAGWLQISIAGGAFIDILTAGGSFAANGYTAGNGWRGISTGYPSFITTIANLPAAAVNQNIQLRWRFTSDSSVSGLGWYVDSVSVGGGYTCCGPAITNAGSALLAENCGSGNGAIDPGETATLNLGLANVGNIDATNVVATLLATGGVTSPSGPQGYGTLLTGGPATSNAFTFTAAGTCGGTLEATLQLQSGTKNLGTVAFSFRLGVSSAILSENFDGVTAPNLPPGWTATLTGAGTRWTTTTAQRDTPPNAVFAPDPGSTSENWLTSPSFFLPASGAQLSFRHAYSTESCCDAGWLQISIAGGTFTDLLIAGGSFVTNGYTAGNGWRGASTGYPSFITTVANLPAAAANQNIRLRWRFTSDSSVSGIGWYVDAVSVGGSYTCCVDTNAPTHFTWDTIPSPECANVPFRVTIRARDDANGAATNFTGVMALTGLSRGALVANTILASPVYTFTASGDWTLGYSFTPNTNLTVTHVRHSFGTKVSIWTDAGTLVASQNVTSTPGTWVETALVSPVQLTAGTTYRVAAYTGGGTYYGRQDLGATFTNGTINLSDQVSGDAFPTSSDTIRWWFVDLRYTVGASVPVPVIPTVSGNFTQGVWTGFITVPQIVSDLVLRADDGIRPAALANPISVVSVPTLGVESDGDMLLMLWPVWPAGSPNFVLETATRLAPEAWVPVTDPPVQIGDVYMLQVGTSEPHRYYRLRLKAP